MEFGTLFDAVTSADREAAKRPMRECPHRFNTETRHFCDCVTSCLRVPPIEPMKARADAEARYDVMPIDVREWLRENEKRWDAEYAGRGK